MITNECCAQGPKHVLTAVGETNTYHCYDCNRQYHVRDLDLWETDEWYEPIRKLTREEAPAEFARWIDLD